MVNIIKVIIIISIAVNNYVVLFAQGYNSDNMELANFLTRMYNNEPFEGVRVVTDYNNTYLISVLSLDKLKYTSQSAMNRVASVKAMSDVNRYYNGSSVSTEIVIHMKESMDGSSDTSIIESIREHSLGYVKELQQLTNFSNGDRQVFIYYKKL